MKRVIYTKVLFIIIITYCSLISCTIKGLDENLVGKWKITDIGIKPDNSNSKYTTDNYIWEFKYDDTYTKKGEVTYDYSIDGKPGSYKYSVNSSGKILAYDYEGKYIRLLPDDNAAKEIRITYELNNNLITFKYELQDGDGNIISKETIKGEKVY